MDMAFAVEYAKKNRSWDMLYACAAEHSLDYDELKELFRLAGLPDNTSEFLAEWYPELAHGALDNLRYTYGFDHSLMWYETEEQLSEQLEWLEVSEEQYEESYGFIIRDAAFNGIVVYGE